MVHSRRAYQSILLAHSCRKSVQTNTALAWEKMNESSGICTVYWQAVPSGPLSTVTHQWCGADVHGTTAHRSVDTREKRKQERGIQTAAAADGNESSERATFGGAVLPRFLLLSAIQRQGRLLAHCRCPCHGQVRSLLPLYAHSAHTTKASWLKYVLTMNAMYHVNERRVLAGP
jgi:hypothetical protein